MKRRLNNYVLLLLGLLPAGRVAAQSDYDLSQRWLNEAIYNPGATGNHLATALSLHARTQWVGTDGAPLTQVATFDTYVPHIRSAFGLLIMHDQIGYLNSYNIKLSYAYHVPVSERSILSFGLSAGWLNRHRDIRDDMADEWFDPLLARARGADHTPEFDFGMEFRSPALKLGASVRHLGFYTSSAFAAPPLTVWSYAALPLRVTGAFGIEPRVSYNYRTAIHYIEAGAILHFAQRAGNFYSFRDLFWLGGMYRIHGQVAVHLGIHISKNIQVGYSFDYGFGDLATLSDKGTHEIFFTWRFHPIFSKDTCCPALGN
ncbi:MAG: PorP/SprF family type IX secretion system membrane protein [Prevotellaceae bacterium]|jgi:type IX secretion system PorP/SprF family membrane protein|nr:PorP/SprF family type IX secretion system membrane protein [Prevotellaceae bacterium]